MKNYWTCIEISLLLNTSIITPETCSFVVQMQSIIMQMFIVTK